MNISDTCSIESRLIAAYMRYQPNNILLPSLSETNSKLDMTKNSTSTTSNLPASDVCNSSFIETTAPHKGSVEKQNKNIVFRHLCGGPGATYCSKKLKL
jgi:hypothetical protein